MICTFWALAVCVSGVLIADTGSSNVMQEVLKEMKQLRYENEMRDLRIIDLESKLQDERKLYDMKFAQQSQKIALLESQQEAVQQSKRQSRQLSAGPRPAFTAYLSKHASNLGDQYIIPFDSVIFNEGHAFNSNTHAFTCPVSGVYHFQTALLSQSHTLIISEIVIDGRQLVQAHAEATGSGGTFDQGFNSVVTKCNKGESVWVRVFHHFGSTVYSERYTTFSGFLLWETEEDASSIVG